MAWYDSIETKVRKNHLANLFALASIDGKIDPLEFKFLDKVAYRWRITKDEVKDVLNNLENIKFVPPATNEEKIEQLIDFVTMMLIDGNIDKKENEYCKKLSRLIGFDTNVVDILIDMIIESIEDGIEPDMLFSMLNETKFFEEYLVNKNYSDELLSDNIKATFEGITQTVSSIKKKIKPDSERIIKCIKLIMNDISRVYLIDSELHAEIFAQWITSHNRYLVGYEYLLEEYVNNYFQNYSDWVKQNNFDESFIFRLKLARGAMLLKYDEYKLALNEIETGNLNEKIVHEFTSNVLVDVVGKDALNRFADVRRKLLLKLQKSIKKQNRILSQL